MAQQATDSVAVKLIGEAKLKLAEHKIKDAIALSNRALREQQRRTGVGSVETVDVLFLLGNLYALSGDLEAGLKVYNDLIPIQEKRLGKIHIDVLQVHFQIANLLQYAEKYENAVKTYEKCLEILPQLPGDQRENMATVYSNIGMAFKKFAPEKCLPVFAKALELRRAVFGEISGQVAVSYQNLSTFYLDLHGEIDSALYYCTTAVAILKKLYPDERNEKLGEVYHNLAMAYETMGKRDSAETYYLKAIKTFQLIFGSDHPSIARIYNQLGYVCSIEKGGILKGREYLLAALDILNKSQYNVEEFKVVNHNNLAENFGAVQEFESALEWAKKALAIHQSLTEKPDYTLSILFNNLGNYSAGLGRREDAIAYYKKALAVKNEVDTPNAPLILHNLGGYFLQWQQHDSAFVYFSKCVEIVERWSKKPDEYPTFLNGMGISCLLTGQDSPALHWLDKSWLILVQSPEHWERLDDKIDCLNALGSVYLLRYRRTADPAFLHTALSYFEKAMALCKEITSNISNYEDLLPILGSMLRTVENGVSAGQKLYQLTGKKEHISTAFGFAEQSRSIALLSSFLEQKALRFAGVPDSVLSEMSDWKSRLTALEKKRQLRLDRLGGPDSVALALSSQILSVREQMDSLKSQIAANFPKYYELRYAPVAASLADVQTALVRPGETWLEYFVGDSSIFAFVVAAQSAQLVEIKLDFPLGEWVDKFREGVFGYHTLPEGQRSPEKYRQTLQLYREYGHLLYQKIVSPLQHLLSGKLVIVPDGVLFLLPFEALLTEPADVEDFSKLPYLIKRHPISYAQSATIQKEMAHKKHLKEPENNFVAFAPFHDTDTIVYAVKSATRSFDLHFTPLPASGAEADFTRHIMNGNAVTGAKATESLFLEICGQYRVLHLATHARADDRSSDYSFLAFAPTKDSTENNLLFVKDIYNLSLNADLVTLSACESGIGKVQRGEGVISLARAFAYAGAKSMVTSLWAVSDAHTARLMSHFYKELKKGKPKDEALRNAKLEHLAKAAPRARHPFFWAGFIPMGDMAPLK